MRHPVDYAPSQDFGDNPTSILPASHWIIKQFGNYQPDGHTGTDYPCPIGTPVRAVADGTVLHVGYLKGSYASNPWWISPSFAGYVAVIDHGHFIGIYGHCLDGSAGVKAGDRVAEGDVFIRSGNTGASTGPHLHFEALPDGYVLNSYMYGRINPTTLFGTIQTQSTETTPTPSEDDEMTAEDTQYMKEKLARLEELSLSFEKVLTDPVTGVIRQAAELTLKGGVGSKYVRSEVTGEDTVYERVGGASGGKLRPIGLAEFQLAMKAGETYRLVPKWMIDALPKV